MDGRRFDDLARGLAAPTRRGLLRGFLGAALGGVLASVGETATAAVCRTNKRSCREHANCCSGYCAERDRLGRRLCACVNGQTDCEGVCTDLETDGSNCGGCGARCGDNGVCEGGRCLGMPGAACAGDDACASGYCVAGVCCSGEDYCPYGEPCGDPDRSPTARCCPNEVGGGGWCECFERHDPGNERIICCDTVKICGTYPHDTCCHDDEECFNGNCVWVEKLCEGGVCPTKCCNGECCGPWDTCGANGCEPLPSCTVENQETVCADIGPCVRVGPGDSDWVCCPRVLDHSQHGAPPGTYDCCPFGQGSNQNTGDTCCPGPNFCGTSRGTAGRY